MTHDDARSLLAAYAAGELEMAEAASVRTHLATGCGECLRTVFEHRLRPAPAADRGSRATPRPAPARTRAPRRRFGYIAGTGVVLVVIGTLAAWELDRRALGTEEAGRITTRLSALEAQHGALATSLARARRDVEEAQQQLTTHEALVRETLARVEPVTDGTPFEPPAFGTADSASGSGVRYADGLVSLHVADVPVAEVLEEIGRQSGVDIRGHLRHAGELSADFDDVPLPEAIERVLGAGNFLLVYDHERRPQVLDLLSASAEPAAGMNIGTVPTAAPSPAAAAARESLLALVKRHPPVSVHGKLAELFGTDTMSLRRLLETGVQHEDQGIRADAMRAALAVLQDEPELRSAFDRAAVDEIALAELALEIAGDRAEEVLFYVAMQAQDPSLRNRAAALLQKLNVAGRTDRGDG